MANVNFHAVLLDETRCEFGADITAPSRAVALARLRENYPESRVVQIETHEEAAAREAQLQAHIARGGDWDDDGHPIFPGGYPDDEGDD